MWGFCSTVRVLEVYSKSQWLGREWPPTSPASLGSPAPAIAGINWQVPHCCCLSSYHVHCQELIRNIFNMSFHQIPSKWIHHSGVQKKLLGPSLTQDKDHMAPSASPPATCSLARGSPRKGLHQMAQRLRYLPISFLSVRDSSRGMHTIWKLKRDMC